MPNSSLDSSERYNDTAVQEMLGQPPGWLLRSGLTMIAVVVSCILFFAGLIEFPEKVQANFVLQTKVVPLPLKTKVDNYVDRILVEDGSLVEAGDTLIVFRAEGDWTTISYLTNWLSSTKDRAGCDLLEYPPPMLPYPKVVSEITTRINTIIAAYKSYAETNGVAAQIKAYLLEVNEAKNLSASLQRQVEFFDQELLYKKKGLQRSRVMNEEGLTSSQDLEVVEEEVISAQRMRENLVAGDAQNRLHVQQLKQKMLSIELAHTEQLADFGRKIQLERELLRGILEEFRQQYFLFAPEAGRVSWIPELRTEILLSAAKPTGFLLPTSDEDRQIVARLNLPAHGQGRIKTGSTVILEFDAYPAQEFGQVLGTISAVAPLATTSDQSSFMRLATVALNDTLITSYKREIPFQYNSTGIAYVITKERTILQRIFDRFYNLSYNR